MLQQQIVMVIAIVTTLLLLLFIALRFFHSEEPGGASLRVSSGVSVLLFLAFSAWTAVLADLHFDRWSVIVLWALPIGAFAALLPLLSARLKKRRYRSAADFDAQVALRITGETLRRTPPSHQGRGKVYLNLRSAPREMEAVSSNGMEIPAGVPIRVVDVVDDRILVVEPLDKRPPDLIGGPR